MNVEQALRIFAGHQATIRFSLGGGFVTFRASVRMGDGLRNAFCETAKLPGPGESLGVLSWMLVKGAIHFQRSLFMAQIAKRFKELHQGTDRNATATIEDLIELAEIADEELAAVEKTIAVKREDASGLVKAYGQTETKD